MDELVDLIISVVNNPTGTDKDKLAKLLSDELSTSTTKADVEDEGSPRQSIALLGPSASQTAILNKINEIINTLNNSLSDYRI